MNSSLTVFDARSDGLIRRPVALNVAGDFLLMIAEIAQRIENLCLGKVGEMIRDSLGRDPRSPEFHNRTDWRARPLNNGFAGENAVIADDVPMFCCRGHADPCLRHHTGFRISAKANPLCKSGSAINKSSES